MFTGYEIKYQGSQTSLRGTTVTIKIYEQGYAGSVIPVILLGDGIKIEAGSRTSYIWEETIFPTSIQCAVLDKDGSIRDDIMGKPVDAFRYVIEEGANILSAGRLPMLEYERPLFVGNAAFNFSGADGLGDLQDSEVVSFANVTASFKDWIVEALKYTGLGLDVEFVTDWTPQFYKSVTRVIENVMYATSALDSRIAYDIIDTLAKGWGCRVYQTRGRWRIEQIELQGNATVLRYDSDGTFIESYAEDKKRILGSESAMLKFIRRNGKYQEIQAHKSANVNWSPQSELQSTGGIRNWQFHNWAENDVRPLFWTLNNLSVDRLTIVGSEFVLMNATWDGTNYMQQAGAYLYPGATNRVVITPKFIVATEDDDPAGAYAIRLRVRIGDWYLKNDGTWTETPTNIILTKAYAVSTNSFETIRSNTLYSVSVVSEGQDDNGNHIVPQDGGDVEVRIMPAEIIQASGQYNYTQWDEVIVQIGDGNILTTASKDTGRHVQPAVPIVFSDFGYPVDSPLREIEISQTLLRRSATSWSRNSSVQTYDERSQQELLAETIAANIGHNRGRYVIDVFSREGTSSVIGLIAELHEYLEIDNKLYVPTYVQFIPKNGITGLVLLDAEYDYTGIDIDNSVGRVDEEGRRSFRTAGSPGGTGTTETGGVPDTRTLQMIGTANQVEVTPSSAQNLSENRAWTYKLAENIEVIGGKFLSDTSHFQFRNLADNAFKPVRVGTSVADANDALNRAAGDGRYGRLAAVNTWTQNNRIKNSYIGEGIRVAGRGELFLHSTAVNNVSEVFFGWGDVYDGSQSRWAISDRGKADGILRFYRAPGLTDDSFQGAFDLTETGARSYGHLRFDGDLKAGSTIVIDLNRNLFAAEGTFSGKVTVNNEITSSAGFVGYGAPTAAIRPHEFTGDVGFFDDVYASKHMRSPTFASGWAGSGWRVTDSAEMELTNLRVRGKLNVYELLINQIRATNGSLFVASAARVETVTPDVLDEYVLTFEDNIIPFAANDVLRAQRFTGTGVYQSNVNVVSITGNDVRVLFVSGDAPAVGMDYVRLGNTTDVNRQGNIYLTSDDSGSPFIDVVNGITAHADWNTSGKIKSRMGKLDGITGGTNEYGIIAGVSGFGVNDRYFKISTAGALFNNINIVYRNTDTGETHALGNSQIAIGNITGTANDAIKIAQTGTALTSGVFAYNDAGAEVFRLRLDGEHQIAGWEIDDTSIWKRTLLSGDTRRADINIRSVPATGRAGFQVLLEDHPTPSSTNRFHVQMGRVMDTGYSWTSRWGFAAKARIGSTTERTLFEVSADPANYSGYVAQIAGWTFDSERLYNTQSGVTTELLNSAAFSGLRVKDATHNLASFGRYSFGSRVDREEDLASTSETNKPYTDATHTNTATTLQLQTGTIVNSNRSTDQNIANVYRVFTSAALKNKWTRFTCNYSFDGYDPSGPFYALRWKLFVPGKDDLSNMTKSGTSSGDSGSLDTGWFFNGGGQLDFGFEVYAAQFMSIGDGHAPNTLSNITMRVKLDDRTFLDISSTDGFRLYRTMFDGVEVTPDDARMSMRKVQIGDWTFEIDDSSFSENAGRLQLYYDGQLVETWNKP